jgi:hypothetical protein
MSKVTEPLLLSLVCGMRKYCNDETYLGISTGSLINHPPESEKCVLDFRLFVFICVYICTPLVPQLLEGFYLYSVVGNVSNTDW